MDKGGTWPQAGDIELKKTHGSYGGNPPIDFMAR